MKSLIIRGGLAAAFVFIAASSTVSAANAQQISSATKAVSGDVAPKGEWDENTAYAVDDIVLARGSSWRAIKASTGRVPGSTSPNNAKYWELFARGFNPLGAWSNATTYQPDDLVTYQGQTYRATKTSANKLPTVVASWEVLVMKGATGATGPAGPNSDIPAGTVSAPSFSFTGDPGTGIYSPATGKIALVENGVTVLHTRGGNAALGWNALSAASPGQDNTAVGSGALMSNTSSYNTGVGANALASNTSGLRNTAVGDSSLATNTAGKFNTALGELAMNGNTQGNYNVAIGNEAASHNTTGEYNVAIGIAALSFNNGSNNIAIGASAAYLAGFNANPSINNSIYIGYSGSLAFSDTIQIGASQTQAFIAGIAGVTVANSAAVLIDTSTGQLGTVASSRRYKEDIAAMGDVSAMLAKLRPVTFHYKAGHDDGKRELQYGLIAEEVAEVLPYLTVFNKDGQPETVKYHLLPSFLLAGYQAQQKTIDALTERDRQHAGEIAELKREMAELKALLPQARAAALQ